MGRSKKSSLRKDIRSIACDPFSKNKKLDVDTIHDEPPELYDLRVKRSQKWKEFDWENEEQRERILQQSGLKSLKLESQFASTPSKIDPKQATESVRDYRKRIRQTLTEELQSMTSTAKKRKEKLKERKYQKKLQKKKKTGDQEGDYHEPDEEVLNFNINTSRKIKYGEIDIDEADQRQQYAIKHQKRKSESTILNDILKQDFVMFGEQVTKPPDLKAFTAKFHKLSEAPPHKKMEAKQSFVPLDKPISSSALVNLKKTSKSGGSDMEALRIQVQEAYRNVRQKRHDEHNAKYKIKSLV